MSGQLATRIVLLELAGDDRLRVALAGDPETKVLAVTSDGAHAVALVRQLRPDAVVLDAGLPEGLALGAARAVMAERPTPVIMAIDDRPETDDLRIAALRAGALLVVPKPPPRGAPTFAARRAGLLAAVRTMGGMTLPQRSLGVGNDPAVPPPRRGRAESSAIVAIAASTGGPAAFSRILAALPPDFRAPVLLTQHLSTGFVHGMVRWLNGLGTLRVKVAEDGETLRSATVYVAADDRHLTARADGTIALSDAPPAARHRPSATVMFASVAAAYGPAALAVVLTGMGSDGVAGLSAIRRAGGVVVAQDEASSVVFGMPKAAIEAGLVDRIVPLERIPPHLVAAVSSS